MKVELNTNTELVQEIRQALKENGGFCPCEIEQTPDTKCMCKDFRDKIADPDFEGWCHCKLYYKEK